MFINLSSFDKYAEYSLNRTINKIPKSVQEIEPMFFRALEEMLEEAGREKGEAEVKLSGAEGRMNGLESQLTRTEGQRKELQLRLANLVSVLQATLGLHDLTQPSLLIG